jgi:HPt (histidine-containing phosphotransfer) domain-containing protein
MDDYVSKPIHLDELADALDRSTRRTVGEPAGVLDTGALEHLAARTGDRDFVRELARAFLRDGPALLAALRGLQVREVRRAAHTLKSNARLFGASALADLCQDLEETAKGESLAGATERLARIDGEYARLAAALQAADAEAT